MIYLIKDNFDIDLNTMQQEYILLWKSIIKWNEINEYSQKDRASINSYLYQDCSNYAEAGKIFAESYPKSNWIWIISVDGNSSRVNALYLPFKNQISI